MHVTVYLERLEHFFLNLFFISSVVLYFSIEPFQKKGLRRVDFRRVDPNRGTKTTPSVTD